MESILSTWGRVFRFIIILLVVILFSTIVVKRFLNNSEVSLEFDDNKTMVKVKNNGQIISQSILAASDCWENTGIKIEPGQSYKIKVTGKIHTAGDYLFRDVSNDTIPSFQWCGPEGRDFRVRTDSIFFRYDVLRKNLLISPNEKIGCVLFYFQDEDTQEPSCTGGDKFFSRPTNIKVYDNNKGILKGTNSGKLPEYIWATVNDMLIEDTTANTRLAYIGSDLKGEDLKKKINKWNEIIKTNYRKLWFDDNIGDYVISVEITQ